MLLTLNFWPAVLTLVQCDDERIVRMTADMCLLYPIDRNYDCSTCFSYYSSIIHNSSATHPLSTQSVTLIKQSIPRITTSYYCSSVIQYLSPADRIHARCPKIRRYTLLTRSP
ncbi:hypothetical protein BKA58DRAFT_189085 [Alternaria rosae]|uniref:uncharacterized protein n=1 Tax=Alternaria rosae TaxID=1187941 RepID=UPI001E8EB9F1|nr:uncharacterized protein BKA58DRAFT_189085 [Alternaria rosae]KAH6868157.1 hypothetical protein BKA58DRAFT_189085 [Alternaria rosae]